VCLSFLLLFLLFFQLKFPVGLLCNPPETRLCMIRILICYWWFSELNDCRGLLKNSGHSEFRRFNQIAIIVSTWLCPPFGGCGPSYLVEMIYDSWRFWFMCAEPFSQRYSM